MTRLAICRARTIDAVVRANREYLPLGALTGRAIDQYLGTVNLMVCDGQGLESFKVTKTERSYLEAF